MQACCALGYAAHATYLLGAILGVPLRYPLMLGLSKSSVLDRATGMGKIGCAWLAATALTLIKPYHMAEAVGVNCCSARPMPVWTALSARRAGSPKALTTDRRPAWRHRPCMPLHPWLRLKTKTYSIPADQSLGCVL